MVKQTNGLRGAGPGSQFEALLLFTMQASRRRGKKHVTTYCTSWLNHPSRTYDNGQI